MTETTTPGSGSRRQALGAYGERLAAEHLVAAGMVLLDRNWRCSEGELDLVLRDGSSLVMCEAKTRTSLSHGSPHEAVTDAKLGRLVRLATRWAAVHGIRPPEIRVDLVAMLRPRTGPTLVEHVRGVC